MDLRDAGEGADVLGVLLHGDLQAGDVAGDEFDALREGFVALLDTAV